jgi:RimJ/RimL family protein N-acetyltransferase
VPFPRLGAVSDLPTLRPLTAQDLPQLRRLATDPDSLGPDWGGYSDAGRFDRRLAEDGMLSEHDGMLAIDVSGRCVGQVSWRAVSHGGWYHCWGIGASVFPEDRGHGHGWRAQRLLVDYLFATTPVHRIQANTRADNVAEQRALTRLGFTLEGTLRGAQFKDGEWRDTLLFSLLRTDR